MTNSPETIFRLRLFAEITTQISPFLPDAHGRVWFGGFADIYCWDKSVVKIFSDDVHGWLFSTIAEDKAGHLWLGTQSGLFRIHPDRPMELTEFTKEQGLTDNDVTCVYPDQAGNIWVGTRVGGLNCLQPRRVMNYTTSDVGLASDDVWSISEAHDGSLWIGTDGGASHYRNGAFANYSEGSHWVVEDQQGTVWGADSRQSFSGLKIITLFMQATAPRTAQVIQLTLISTALFGLRRCTILPLEKREYGPFDP